MLPVSVGGLNSGAFYYRIDFGCGGDCHGRKRPVVDAGDVKALDGKGFLAGNVPGGIRKPPRGLSLRSLFWQDPESAQFASHRHQIENRMFPAYLGLRGQN